VLRQEGPRPPASPNVPQRTEGLSPSFGREIAGLSWQELLQVRERVRGERLPLFIIIDDERNRRIAKLWRIPGTSVRVSLEGDIYYPVWRERSRVNKSELYAPCSKLPRGWSFERLLVSKRRPISEVKYFQVKKDSGAIEAAIRSMDHVLENYQEEGRELGQVEAIREQIARARKVLEETTGVSREEFEEGFEILYRQTLELLEKCGLSTAASALKKDITRLLAQVSIGRDRLGRRNPLVMLKKLEAATARVEYRWHEAGFIIDKFSAMKAGLEAQRAKDREILRKAEHQLSVGFAAHSYFKEIPQEVSKQQVGILIGMMGSLVYMLGQARVKPYKTVAKEIMEELSQAQQKVREGDYQGAKKLLLQSQERISLVT